MKLMHLDNTDKFSLIMTVLSAIFVWVVNGVVHPVMGYIHELNPAIISWTHELCLVLACIVSLITIYKFFKYRKK